MTADGELAREAAEVFAAADPTGSKSIRQLAELVARRVPACSGATAALWQAGEMVTMAASDPDVAALTSLQIETRSGPLIETLRTKQPGGCADTLADDRWQEFAAAALSKGVRDGLAAPGRRRGPRRGRSGQGDPDACTALRCRRSLREVAAHLADTAHQADRGSTPSR